MVRIVLARLTGRALAVQRSAAPRVRTAVAPKHSQDDDNKHATDQDSRNQQQQHEQELMPTHVGASQVTWLAAGGILPRQSHRENPGAGLATTPARCKPPCDAADLEGGNNGDVDEADFAVFQAVF
jgi:hypothetical protein